MKWVFEIAILLIATGAFFKVVRPRTRLEWTLCTIIVVLVWALCLTYTFLTGRVDL